MANLMDNVRFNSVQPQAACTMDSSIPYDLREVVQQARQNPRAFEERISQMNPQGYQRALQIRNSANPQSIIMQMAQSRGIGPNIFKLFGL